MDRLEFSATGFGGGLVADFAPEVVNTADAALASAVLGIGYFNFDTAGANKGALYWDATGGSGTDAVMVAIVTGVTSLMTGDLKRV